MWYEDCIYYQIYPLGFCGAPMQNDGQLAHKMEKVTDWIPHLQKLGIGAVLFNPLFESDAHGYDTRDYKKVDVRLGTNEDFKAVCDALHSAGMKVVLDGVFHHVGRGFWAFEDVRQNRENSPYRDWFQIDFGGDSNYGDGFWYEGWEGHFELVKLNLSNPAVTDYLLSCVSFWMDEFSIDGIRLDVAYLLPHDFMRRLHSHVRQNRPDFFLLGEMLHGDYKGIVNDEMLQSATNYECYKGLFSSLNSHNLFEIAYSLSRQFGPEDWTLYKGLPLFNFVDNHDVTRAATILSEKKHLPLLYGMLFGMPGIPSLYYGSEWGAEGDKSEGDAALRPAFEKPLENDLFALIVKMCQVYNSSDALRHGAYRQVYLTNQQFLFERKTGAQRILVALNAENASHTAHFDAGAGMATDLLSGQTVDFGGGFDMGPYSIQFLEMEH
ncbi:hypothetical protein LJC49_08035 [Ruminococcaceae bacterium OttesenSCG-928-I18]|nr:hypothetical protein [Ruminococcaceae bacterium OttesenSCG-928-I18]